MTRRCARLAILVAAVLVMSSGTLPGAATLVDAATPAQVQIYGAWHCSDDYCTWGKVRDLVEFDQKNHWLVDRGAGAGPSVNLVVLSFVNPLKLLNQTNDATTVEGVPKGMTSEIVNYFTSRGIRVMLSIGGITYTKDWNTALAQNATLLGQRAAAVATRLGVGIEIDYEENRSPNLPGLQAFIDAYRSLHPYGGADRGRPTDHRPRGRRPLAHRDHAEGHRGLAPLGRPGPRLRQRHGSVQAADQPRARSRTGRSTWTGSPSTRPRSRRSPRRC